MKNITALELNKKVFKETLKSLKLDFILLMLLDALFYFLCGLIITLWKARVEAKMQSTYIPSQDQIISMGYEKAQEILFQTKSFYYMLLLFFLLLLLALIFVFSIIKGVIWARTAKVKISMYFLGKFMILNLVWLTPWMTLFIFISRFVEISHVIRFMTIALIVAFFLTSLLYSIFVKDQKISSIKEAFKIISEIKFLAVPYITFFIAVFLLLRLSYDSITFFNYLFIVLLLAIFTFFRYYTYNLVSSIKH